MRAGGAPQGYGYRLFDWRRTKFAWQASGTVSNAGPIDRGPFEVVQISIGRAVQPRKSAFQVRSSDGPPTSKFFGRTSGNFSVWQRSEKWMAALAMSGALRRSRAADQER